VLLSVEKKIPPNGVRNLSFYRPREGPGVHERERKRRKRKNREEESPEATSSFFSGGRVSLVV
jgi:hypothetical protein